MAAIIGRHFEIGLLAKTLGEEAETVEEHLLPALQVGLIRAWQRGFAFDHDLVRKTLYRQVPTTRRRRLHGFIGHALETQRQAQTAQQLSNLAFHLTRSGDRQRFIQALGAAPQCRLRFSHDPNYATDILQNGCSLKPRCR